MGSHTVERLRYLNTLLQALLDLDAPAQAQRLAQLDEAEPATAIELRRLLALALDDDDLAAGGGLTGSLAQECLLGADVPAVPAGTRVGPFRIDSLLGRGGMGDVYTACRAFDGFEQRVALKLVRAQVDASSRRQLALEQRALVRLDHPNIARFLDAGVDAAHGAYLAMELVEGTPLTLHAERRGADIDRRIGWVLDLCGAVAHAHAHLIVHCDIKPSNVLVDAGDRVRLLDFGIAQLLGDALAAADGPTPRFFTRDYAAPEQLEGRPATTCTDIFQLGALLHHLATGTPWTSADVADVAEVAGVARTAANRAPMAPSQRIRRLAAEAATRDQMQAHARACGCASPEMLARRLQGAFDAIVLKCLAPDPGERYANVQMLDSDLRRWRGQRPVSALPMGLGGRLRLWLRRHRARVALTAVAAACVAAVALVAALQVGREQDQRAREQARAVAMEGFLAKVFLQASPYMGSGDKQALDTLSRVGDSLLVTEPGLDARTRARLSVTLARLELDRGQPALAEARARKVLRGVADDEDPALRLELYGVLGSALIQQDRLDAALAALDSAIALAERQPIAPARKARLLATVGDVHRREGRMTDARRYMDPAIGVLFSDELPVNRDSLDAVLMAATYIDQSGEGMDRLPAVARRLSRSASAESAVARAQRLMALSYVEVLVGRPDAAGTHAEDAARAYADVLGRDHPQVVKARGYACTAFRDGGALARAAAQCEAALASLARGGRLSSDDGAVFGLNLAGIAFSTGNFDQARQQIERLGTDPGIALSPFQDVFASMLRGRLHYRRGDPQRALAAYAYVESLQRKHFPGHAELLAHIAEHRIPALLADGQVAAARHALRDAQSLALPKGLATERAGVNWRLLQARVAGAEGAAERAAALVDEGLAAQARLSSVSDNEQAWALLDAGETLLAAGKREQAAALYRRALDHGLDAASTPGLWAWAQLRLASLAPGSEGLEPVQATQVARRQFGARFSPAGQAGCRASDRGTPACP